jgi:hypothetical protein
MGTNFYLGRKGDHIGKRSAAGFYCFDCGVTLCKRGDGYVHHGPDNIKHDAKGFIDWEDYFKKDRQLWYEVCPRCGQKPIREKLTESAIGKELGFNKEKPERKSGVRGCSSFSWAMEPMRFANSRARVVYDEYGRKYTKKDFQEMLNECPIKFTRSIGLVFS